MKLFLVQTIQRDSAISFPMLGSFSFNPPSSFSLFGLNIYYYGVIIALGFILAMVYCSRNAKDFGIKSDDFFDLMLWIIPCCIIGARLYYVLFNLEHYLADPGEIFAIRDGGLAIYGGIIVGVIVIIGVSRHKKIPIPAMLDLAVFGLLIGQILGRWGNFMNREAFGAETEIFCRMGLTAPDGSTIFVHPTFLYESLWNLAGLIFLIVWTKKGHRKYDGQCTLIYFFWYGLGRAWIEGLRTDSLYWGSFRVSQILAAVSCLLAVGVLLYVLLVKRPDPANMLVNRAAASAEKPAPEEASED